MSKSDNYQVTSGWGGLALTLIGVMFIYLKLTGQTAIATWSWVWVLAPFWLPAAIILTLLVVFLILAAIIVGLDKKSLGR